jgi:hypothetical protein
MTIFMFLVCISRPFDKDREGFVLSEGAGLVMLERAEDAMKRNSKIYAEVVGYGKLVALFYFFISRSWK